MKTIKKNVLLSSVKIHLIAILLCVLLGMSFMGCRLKNAEKVGVKLEQTSQMNEIEMVQFLLTAIQSRDKAKAIYDGIPKKQKNEISLNMFLQYMELMENGIGQEAKLFSEVKEEVATEILNKVAKCSEKIQRLYKNVKFYWIYSDEYKNSKFLLAIHKDKNGMAYFSRDWMESLFLLNDFKSLYFSAIQERQSDRLASLFMPRAKEYQKDYFEEKLKRKKAVDQDEVIALLEKINKEKARQLISTYQKNKGDVKNQLKLIQILPHELIMEDEFFLINQQGKKKIIFLRSNEAIEVEDYLPQDILEADLKILYKDKDLFNIEVVEDIDELTSEKIETIMDVQTLIYSGNSKTESGKEDTMLLEYAGMQMTILGDKDIENQEWHGKVNKIFLSNSDFSLGSGLKVSDSIFEVQARYPFCNERNNTLTLNHEDKKIKLTFEFIKEHIANISIEIERIEKTEA